MDLTQLKPEVLKSLLKLSEQKAALLKEIEAIDNRISTLSTGRVQAKSTFSEAGQTRGRPRGRPSKVSQFGGRRGVLKIQILEVLQGVGSEGIAVKEIAHRLGVKNQNVHVWFSSTGKKLPEIVKVGEARYALASRRAHQENTPSTSPHEVRSYEQQGVEHQHLQPEV